MKRNLLMLYPVFSLLFWFGVMIHRLILGYKVYFVTMILIGILLLILAFWVYAAIEIKK